MGKFYKAFVLLALIAILFLIFHKRYFNHSSIIEIRNTRWAKVHIQICKKLGIKTAGTTIIFDQTLAKGQTRSFTINKGDDILYRVDKNPDHADGVHFTNWEPAAHSDSAICEIDNP